MKYVLFIGSKLGYEAIKILTELNCHIEHVFIEKEHEHEHEKYYAKSKDHCEIYKIPFSINAGNREIQNTIEEIDAFDYVMSFGYRRMISELAIKKASISALGTHFSPLPRYRGFAPLNWVLINGEDETAVNLFYLDEKVDNGDIIASRKVKIDNLDDINSLYEKCIVAFTGMMKEAIPLIESKSFQPKKQDESKATYTCARNPEDGLIDWNWDSRRIYNFVRALTYPFPGAFTFLDGKRVIIWSCEEYEIPKYEGIIPGKVIKIIKDSGVVVLCGEGAILIKDIATEEQQNIKADEFISSIRVTLGKR
ncbi:methionyl-tRNA formyltransferase [Petrocella sp. FN5]|uniref:methionyl-tRNA formyltransferase n=1 Tax=Petrocella sp. FN5 TaxID=3032002 RepID=UPI0023DBB006|nr:methionyl-tRNA formyltransferase [Petrocella sp. FN5]MDF1616149.1 methionyl-tRNA formyltransferase [Petrocella sp. FN5]